MNDMRYDSYIGINNFNGVYPGKEKIMKKVISTILALSLIVGGFKATSYEQVKDGNSYVITADAATTNTEAGKNAGKYSYEFADTSMYTTTLSSVTVGVKDSNGKVTNQTSWEDSVNGNKYGIIRVQVKDNNNKNEVVLDEYRIGLITAKNTNLDVKMSDEVSIPSNVDLSVAKITADTIIGKNATVIAASAFNNSYLKTIDLSGVEFIGANAFQKCQFITEVAIPATVKFVGEGVFGNSGLKKLTVSNDMPVVPAKLCTATKLTEVSFAHPDFIRVIGNNAFSNTPLAAPIFNSWSDISAYEEHIEIEDSAFQNCTSFTGTINVADNIYYLGKNAFSGCSGVKSLIFGKDLTHCDQNCFKGCTSLSSIKFNNCVESLAGGCFQGCSSLLKVEGIPATVYDWVPEDSSVGAGIGDGVFADCTSLQSAVIPRSLTRISQSMFENCTSLTSVTFCNPGGEAVTESPEIVKIKNKAFSNCPKLTAVSYPKAVEIGESAFSGCTGVVSVSIPSSLYIRKNAFSKCTSMTTFKAGECKIVGNNALEGCTSITDITLLADQYGGDEKNSPDATGSTHGYVFKDCTAAKKITIKTSGKVKLSAGLFSGCSALESVGADLSNISVIGKDCFSGCEKLPKVNMPGLVIIEDSGFANCSALKSISDSGNAISAQDYGSRCFQNCSALDIEVTGNISTIGSYAFNKSGVTKVAIDGMVGGTIVIGDSAFGDCEKLASASILSSGVEKFSVGSNVFANCPILTNAVFEGPIITKGMFQNCAGLTKLETTADVFYENAFSGCTKLPQVTKKGDSAAVVAKEINGTAFVNCSALTNSSSDKDTVFKGSGQYKGCSSLASAEVKTLTASMFQNCSNLSKVTLGADVVSVYIAVR